MPDRTTEYREPKVIAIAGGSCSGKTYLSRLLHQRLGPDQSQLLAFDRYYKRLEIKDETHMDLPNFDHPDAMDFELFGEHVAALKSGKSIRAPIYDFSRHARLPETDPLDAKPVVVVEGHLVLHEPAVRQLFDRSYFVRCPEPLRLQRRMERDQAQRGRSEASVRQQFEQTVAPMHDQFVSPSRVFADIVLSQEQYLERTSDVVDSIIRDLESLNISER